MGVATERAMRDVAARPAGRRWRRFLASPVILLALLVVLVAAIDVWWLERFRAGYPVNIDEADYLGFGLVLKDALAHGGPAGLWHAWAAQTHFGPLLPLLSVPVLAVLGESVVSGLIAQLLFLVALLVASYALGSALSTRRGGVLTAVVVAATPAILDYSRTFEFAVTAAAVLTAATYFLIASEALTRRSWSIAWGVALGLLPLARTMTIAFLPGQIVVAAWLIVARPGPRRPRVLNGALALAAALITAGTWFVKSWHAQLQYLTNFGYGTKSERYAGKASELRVGFWTRELVNTVTTDLYLPLAIVVVIAGVVGVLAVVLRERHRATPVGWLPRLRELSSSDPAIVLFIVLEGYLAITSSRNEGVAFRVPLLPAVAALAVGSMWRAPKPWLRNALVGGCACVATFNVLMKADLTSATSGRLSAELPGFGTTPIADGLGYIQNYTIGALEAPYGSPTHPLPASARRWLGAYRSIDAAFLARRAAAGPNSANVELTVDEPLLNAHDLTFAARLYRHVDIVANVLPGVIGRSDLLAYVATLAGGQGQGVNTVVSVDRTGFSYFAPAQAQAGGQQLFQEAATALGYTCVGTVALPDKRTAFIQMRALGRRSQTAAGCRPQVTRTAPAADATGVAVNSPIVIVLDRPLAPSLPSNAVKLSAGPHSSPVPGRTARFGDQTLVFIPRGPLLAHTTVTVTLSAATTVTGAALARPYSWRFTTR